MTTFAGMAMRRVENEDVFLIAVYVIAAIVLVARWMKREQRTWAYVLARCIVTLVLFAVAMLLTALFVLLVAKAYTRTEGTTLIGLAGALAWLFAGPLLYVAFLVLAVSWWLAGVVVAWAD